MFSSSAISALLIDLHTVSGLRLSLFDTEGKELIAYPEEVSGYCAHLNDNTTAHRRCQASARESFENVRQSGTLYMKKCPFGLWSATCPLYRSGVLIGYLRMEQGKDASHTDEEERLPLALPFSESPSRLSEELRKLPSLSKTAFEALVRLMTLCAEHVASLTTVSVPTADLTEAVLRYINRNLGSKLTVAHLCSAFHCSKSTLMNLFRNNCGVTLGEYLTERRIAMAKELLQFTAEPIGNIALKCGFADQGYFSKVFSARVGCPPSLFRRYPQGR